MQHPVKTKTFDEPMRDYNNDHNLELGINVAIARIATSFLGVAWIYQISRTFFLIS